MANGSIVVLGAVKGSVYAGLGGDDSAFIVALDMDPDVYKRQFIRFPISMRTSILACEKCYFSD